MLPDGLMVSALAMAVTTSCGDNADSACSLAGSSVTTMVRALPPNGGGAETPGQGRKQRAHRVEREILDLPDAARLAREGQVANRHAAGVEAHHEWRAPCPAA